MPSLESSWPFVLLAVVMVISAITDIRNGKVYNVVTVPAMVVGLTGHAVTGGWLGEGGMQLGLAGSLTGLVVGFGPMLAIFLIGGIGGGDVKLSAAIGALGGWRFAVQAMFFGLVAAVVMAVIVMLTRRIFGRTMLRIWRFVVLAFSGARPADPTGAESPTIPFGLALCVGSAGAMAHSIIQGAEALKWPLGI